MQTYDKEQSIEYARPQLKAGIHAESSDGDITMYTHYICEEAIGEEGILLDAKAVEEYAYFLRDYCQTTQSLYETQMAK